MGILDIFRDAPDERISLVMENNALQDEVHYLSSEIRDIQEDMLRISDAFDNVGWSQVGIDGEEATEIPLQTVKKVAKLARAMNLMNPFIKRGVNARISYVWGKGLSFEGIDSCKEQINRNRKIMFSPQAYEELERVLATDGNAFTALPVKELAEIETAYRIPLEKIVGSISNPRNKEEIWYYKVEDTTTKTDRDTGQETTDTVTKWYASMPYFQKLEKEGKNLPRRWNKFGVEQNYVIHHTSVNKQVGWRWGVPDIMPVIFWAKAYKEYLEDNAMLVKAYSRLAWMAKASTGQGAQAMASQVLAPPTRDPLTGELRNIGATAVGGAGMELSPVANHASTVDFSKGSALASAIASGLEVSKVVITSDPGEGNRATAETLDLPTLKAMESRQQLHTNRFLEIFEFWGADVYEEIGAKKTQQVQEAADEKPANEDTGPKIASVTWPQIESDSTKDRVAALVLATVDGNLLYREEARKELIDIFGIVPFKPWDVVPTPEDDPYKQYEAEQAEVAFQREQEAAKQVVATQGNSGGTACKGGAMSTNNQARDNRAKDSKNS